MAPERKAPQKVGRKLTKRRKPERILSIKYPESLKEGDDVQEDVTAVKGQPSSYAHQSVFSMIAAAGSRVDFHARFDDESSGSEEEPDQNAVLAQDVATESVVGFGQGEDKTIDSIPERLKKDVYKHKQSELLPALDTKTGYDNRYMTQRSPPLSSGQELPGGSPRYTTPRDAPVMSRMLEAQAKLSSSTEPLEAQECLTVNSTQAKAGKGHTALVARLMEIFGFNGPEEVIAGLSHENMLVAYRLIEH